MGINKNLYFLNHDKQEGENSSMLSKFNEYEAQMIVNFTQYLVKQNYRGD